MIFPLTVTGEPVTENPVGAISPTLVTVPDPPPPPPPLELIVWKGQAPVIVMLAPATRPGVAVPVPPLATGRIPVVPVARGRPVALARLTLDGVPSAGLTRVGLFANTSAPVPVSSLTTPASCAEVVAANWARVPAVEALAFSAAWAAVDTGLSRSLVLLALASPTVAAVARAAMAEADTSPVLIGAAVPVPAPAPVATK